MSNLTILLLMLCNPVILHSSENRKDPFGVKEIQNAQSRRQKPKSLSLFNAGGIKKKITDESKKPQSADTRAKKVYDKLSNFNQFF